ncbi:MAG: hypothetical protein C4522_17600 [Desulfobacteraceae bacterium]|nr:MAG: hypothetical protein C4522_17600 [Desulfobacteraceae bacterium]
MMSHWNHRVIKRHDKKVHITTFQIHEVYYDDDNKIESWTASPVEPMGESMAELRKDLQYFVEALEKPVLEEKIQNGQEILVEINQSAR